MKTTLLKLTAACALAFAMASGAQAQILSNDPFLTSAGNYTVGGVNGQNPTVTGFNGAWNQSQLFNGGSGAVVSTTTISYAAPTGYSETPGAGSLVESSSNARVARPLASTVSSAFGATSGTIWMSFELQLANISTGNNNYQAIELGSDTTGDSRFLQLGFSSFGDFGQSTSFGVAVNQNSGSAGTLGAVNTSANLFVVELNLASGNNDTLNVWENPTSLAGSTPTTGTGEEATISGFSVNVADVADLELGTFDGGAGTVNGTTLSEIRIGDTLGDVATVPEPSVTYLALFGLGALFLIRRQVIA